MRKTLIRIGQIGATIATLLIGSPAHALGLLNAGTELGNAGKPSFGEAAVGRGPEQLAERV